MITSGLFAVGAEVRQEGLPAAGVLSPQPDLTGGRRSGLVRQPGQDGVAGPGQQVRPGQAVRPRHPRPLHLLRQVRHQARQPDFIVKYQAP